MTDREALELVKASLCKYINYVEDTNPILLAYYIAVNALRRRVDREYYGCDWCEGGAYDIVFGNDFHGDISDGNLLQIDHAGQSGSRRINFCPMCGKDLIHKD